MLKHFSRIAAIGVLAIASAAAAPVKVTFETRDGKTVSAGASTLESGDEIITLGLRDWDLSKCRVNGEPVKRISFDPITGLIRAELNGALEETQTLGDSSTILPGTTLDAQTQAAVFIGWQSRIEGNIPPLLLMRVRFEEGSVPPGTALSDPDGKVVAYVYQAVAGKENEAYAVPVEAATRLIKASQTAGIALRPWVGISMEFENSCPEIVGIRADAPADKAGLQKGDILLAVGDRQVTSYVEAVDAFYYMIAGEPIGVTVLRNMMVVNVEVTPAVHPIQGGS